MFGIHKEMMAQKNGIRVDINRCKNNTMYETLYNDSKLFSQTWIDYNFSIDTFFGYKCMGGGEYSKKACQ